MKKIQIIALMLALCGATISCDETFLDVPPPGVFTEKDLTTGSGIKSTLIGAYSLLNGGGGMVTSPANILFGTIRGGQGHKGSTQGDQPQMIEVEGAGVTTSNSSASSIFTFNFNAVDRCNIVLKYVEQVPIVTTASAAGITEAEKTQIITEARFLRAHYYFQLARLFKNLPWIDETLNPDFTTPNDVKVPNTDASGNYTTVWSKIKDEFAFAIANLPATQTDWGRPNSWAAKAYYAKTLLYMANDNQPGATYAEALSVMTDVRLNGKQNGGNSYALNTNYRTNYDADNENAANKEWVWGVQHVVNDGTAGTSAPNGMSDMGYLDTFSGSGKVSPGWGRGFGFLTATGWFVNKFLVDANGLPILDDAARNAVPVNNSENTIPFVVDSRPVDPRLDFTVGRQGIPFWDFGLHVGGGWVREPNSAGTVTSKKYYIWNKDDGKYVPTNGQPSALNIPIIRYADVILMCAELEVRAANNLLGAAALVNQVRNRMITSTGPDNRVKKYVDNSKPSLGFTTTNAANYNIGLYPTTGVAPFDNATNALKAIFMERNLELGFEGHNGYDVIRFGEADGTFDLNEYSAYFAYEREASAGVPGGKRTYLVGREYTKVPDQLIPIPQTAIDNSFKDGGSTLKQNPGY